MANENQDKIRIRFTDNLKKNEPTVLRAIAAVGPIAVKDVYLAEGGAFITLYNKDEAPKLQTKEARDILSSLNMRCVIANNFAEKTVFITKIRAFVNDYNNEEILESFNNNNDYKADRVFKVQRRDYRPGQTISIKVTMATKEGVQQILTNGAKFLNM